MTRRETEPGPALVLLIQDTDSEEFLGKGRFSHTPDLLMHSLMLDTSHSPRTPLLHWLQGMGQDTRSALSLEDYTSSWVSPQSPTGCKCCTYHAACSADVLLCKSTCWFLQYTGSLTQPPCLLSSWAKTSLEENQSGIQWVSATHRSCTKTCLGFYIETFMSEILTLILTPKITPVWQEFECVSAQHHHLCIWTS